MPQMRMRRDVETERPRKMATQSWGASPVRRCLLGSPGLPVTMTGEGGYRGMSLNGHRWLSCHTQRRSAAPSLYALEPLLPRPPHNELIDTAVTLTGLQIALQKLLENSGCVLQPSLKGNPFNYIKLVKQTVLSNFSFNCALQIIRQTRLNKVGKLSSFTNSNTAEKINE